MPLRIHKMKINRTVPFSVQTPLTEEIIASLRAGDMVLLSGDLYTARDAAHRRMVEAVQKGLPPPVDLKTAAIFYAAPSPTPPGKIIGSIGPTTSYRMDAFTPFLMEQGLRVMIGKGNRSPEVAAAIQKYGGVYFGAIGGIAALTARCVIRMETVAYGDLGPEAIRSLTVVDLPLVVANDAQGNDLYKTEQNKWRISL
ncbi:MAG TPA: FumA C-terminus/TtdB family hydratase beta subunit [Smithellaceae bacterium]|nr:FumA C-terminus/TtdB family hydratase beta subunit [Smithellaceae bacterium]HRS83849.1 FumA C-terminus/TtdB family hydratase beta subunit [Smithellaceae bacterium]HRV45949.1 FumA C-terminus/TtdB family hydratase beta subunit [Smithellaceae bacterium]